MARRAATSELAGRVVVTGAAGFIGAHLLSELLEASWSVVAIDRYPCRLDGTRRNQRDRLRVVTGDLWALGLERWLRGASVVVHLAALPGVAASWAAVADYLHANVALTERVAAACVAVGVPRLVLASSSSVYGQAQVLPTSERVRPRPASPYGVSKLAAEQIAFAHARRAAGALEVVALRYFSVYGPGQPAQRPDMLIGRLLAGARSGASTPIYGRGTQRRDWTYITDAVAATVAAITTPRICGVVNIAGGGCASVAEVIACIQAVTGRQVPTSQHPARPGEVACTQAAVGRARRLLGWQPKVSLRAGLAAHWAWLNQSSPPPTPPPVHPRRRECDMHTLTAGSASELVSQAVALVVDAGEPVAPRGLPTREVLDVHLCLTEPRQRLADLPPARTLNPAFAVAEAVWVLAGRDDTAWILRYNRALARFTDDGRLQGAYGPRLRGWQGQVDQLDVVRRRLLADPATRQAVVQLYDPAHDRQGFRDVPCTLGYRFQLRAGRLCMRTTMRSQDAWLGLPYDLFTATVVQEVLAGLVGAELGAYHHTIDSLHLYVSDLPAAEALAAQPSRPAAGPPPLEDLRVPWPRLDALLAHLLDGQTVTGGGWRAVSTTLRSYTAWKQGDRAAARRLAGTVPGELGRALERWYEHLTSNALESLEADGVAGSARRPSPPGGGR